MLAAFEDVLPTNSGLADKAGLLGAVPPTVLRLLWASWVCDIEGESLVK